MIVLFSFDLGGEPLRKTKLPYGQSREVEFTKMQGKDGEQMLNYKQFDAGYWNGYGKWTN